MPVKVLSAKFRGKFLALLNENIPMADSAVLDKYYNKKCGVYCKPPFKNAGYVVEYLGRYTHRIAISNNRILISKTVWSLFDGVITVMATSKRL